MAMGSAGRRGIVVGFGWRRELEGNLGAGRGITESVGLGFLQEVVAALGDAFEREVAEGDAFHFFDGM